MSDNYAITYPRINEGEMLKKTFVIVGIINCALWWSGLTHAKPPTTIVSKYKYERRWLYRNLSTSVSKKDKINSLLTIAAYASRYEWGDYKDAEWAFDEIINNYPEEVYAVASSYYFSAQFYRYVIEDYDEAIRRLNKFEEIFDPYSYVLYGGFSGIDPNGLLGQYTWKNNLDLEIADLNERKNLIFSKLSVLGNGTEPEHDVSRGDIHREAGQLNKAIYYYEKASKNEKSEKETVAKALLNIGDIYSEDMIILAEKTLLNRSLLAYTGDNYLSGKTKFYRKALNIYKEVIEKYEGTKSHEIALLNMGKTLMVVGVGTYFDISRPGIDVLKEKIGDYDGAIKVFTEYMDKYPYGEYLPYAKYYMGVSFEKKDQKNKAKETFEKIVKDYPEHNVVDMAKKSLLLLEGE